MTFSFLGLTGYGYGLAIGASALAYLALAGVLGYGRRLPAGTVRLYGLFALPMGLLFSRILYGIVNISYYTESISQPWRMLAFWDGGFSLLGMLCGLVLATLVTSRILKIRFGTLLDVTTVPLGLLIAGFRLAEGLTAGQLGIGRQVEAEGIAQAIPMLFTQDQQGTMIWYRLAVYRYEVVVALLILAVMLWLFAGQKNKRNVRQGDVAMIFYALFGASGVLLESLRDDGHMLLGFIRAQQLGYALMPILALAIFGARYAHIREANKRTIAAWLLLPVALLVALLMVYPINHVLDLTGKLPIGFAMLAALVAYMALFLRVRGANLRLIVSWLIALVAVIGCVMVEFSIDGSKDLLRDYTIMAICCAALFGAPFSLWRKLKSHVYLEESISVHID